LRDKHASLKAENERLKAGLDIVVMAMIQKAINSPDSDIHRLGEMLTSSEDALLKDGG